MSRIGCWKTSVPAYWHVIEPLHLDPTEVADELRADAAQQAAAEAAEEQS